MASYRLVMAILSALLVLGTAANIVRIYRQGYIEGGPTGKVARTDPDFRWRIALFWVALVVWLFLCVRAILMLS